MTRVGHAALAPSARGCRKTIEKYDYDVTRSIRRVPAHIRLC